MTRSAVRRVATIVVASAALAACSSGPSITERQRVRDAEPSRSTATSAGPAETAASDAVSTWGPTAQELGEAASLVDTWSSDRLAGQLIVGRFHGGDPEAVARMVTDHHLAGVSITNGNVVDEPQVRALTSAITDAAAADDRDFPPVIGVDQEGGYVSHLRGIATEFPAFVSAGAAIEGDPKAGGGVVREAARATGLELRDLGFTWVFAPVADVTIGAADPTIGSRSPSTDPTVAAKATAAAVRGFGDAGIVSTPKHFPGHGSALTDSHDALPELDATLDELRLRDLPPFEAAIANGAPAIMMGHLDMTALAPGLPASLAPEAYGLLRDDLGFEGVALTDSMGMGAVSGVYKPAVAAINAGADLLLMPVDTAETHRIVTAAIDDGDISRERAEEAAARVVALQRWQQRAAQDVPVPVDVETLAHEAAAALVAAAS